MKRLFVYNYVKDYDDWALNTIVRFDDFDEDGIEGHSLGLVRKTGLDYPKEVYLATIFKTENLKITIEENGVEKTIYEDKEGEE